MHTFVSAAITFVLNCSVNHADGLVCLYPKQLIANLGICGHHSESRLQVDKARCLGFISEMSTADWVWDVTYMVCMEPLGLIGDLGWILEWKELSLILQG